MRDTGTMQDQKEVAAPGRICIVANLKSGRNSRDAAAVDAAAQVLGAEVLACTRPDRLGATLDKAVANRPDMIVSAGGDGTAVATAGKLLGTGIAMAVLPLGTFNYFARGLGLDPDPAEAARQIVTGRIEPRRLGQVNGQIFLNNASVGVYPRILKEREAIYRRWGRRRLMAHWSVIRSFLRFRRPMRVRLDTGDGGHIRKTALVFVGRSGFQLARFGLAGGEAIKAGGFAVLVVRAESRGELFRRVARLAAGAVEEGVDYDLIQGDRLHLDLPGKRRMLLAYDGEKRKMDGPLRFAMTAEELRLVMPRERE